MYHLLSLKVLRVIFLLTGPRLLQASTLNPILPDHILTSSGREINPPPAPALSFVFCLQIEESSGCNPTTYPPSKNDIRDVGSTAQIF